KLRSILPSSGLRSFAVSATHPSKFTAPQEGAKRGHKCNVANIATGHQHGPLRPIAEIHSCRPILINHDAPSPPSPPPHPPMAPMRPAPRSARVLASGRTNRPQSMDSLLVNPFVATKR